MKHIAASKFKEKCLSLLDQITPDGFVITKHGKPIAKVIPVGFGSGDLIGSLKHKISVNGDILSTGVLWDAES